MFFARLKIWFCALAALAVGAASLFFVWGMNATRFPDLEGERVYYLRSASSQALMKNSLTPLDFSLLRGESVRLNGVEDGFAERLINDYGGQVLFTEETGSVRSYYCYAPELYGGVQVGEYFVNLHIAVNEKACVVGSPIIFGGF